jgi:hypothetical protein
MRGAWHFHLVLHKSLHRAKARVPQGKIRALAALDLPAGMSMSLRKLPEPVLKRLDLKQPAGKQKGKNSDISLRLSTSSFKKVRVKRNGFNGYCKPVTNKLDRVKRGGSGTEPINRSKRRCARDYHLSANHYYIIRLTK